MNDLAASLLVVLLRMSVFLGRRRGRATSVEGRTSQLIAGPSRRLVSGAVAGLVLVASAGDRSLLRAGGRERISSAPIAPLASHGSGNEGVQREMAGVEEPPTHFPVDMGIHNALPRPRYRRSRLRRRSCRSPVPQYPMARMRRLPLRGPSDRRRPKLDRGSRPELAGGHPGRLGCRDADSGRGVDRRLSAIPPPPARERSRAEEAWVREWEDLLARHHVRTGVPLWVTADVGPLLCLTPRGYRLVVPEGLWQRLAPAGRLSILRHELAHLRRRDL